MPARDLRGPPEGSRPRIIGTAVGVVAMVLATLVAVPAMGTHGLANLPGSSFEIDEDANLRVDHPGLDDWASVVENRRDDEPSGRDDDSYKGGAKEDDPCPGTTTGSIPNNKSDLKAFGAYVEPGDPGFLHLFWTRVQEPSGTTLMDFELNQSATDCGNGVNPVRTVGDLLIEYRIEQGGGQATIMVREWTGSAWGTAEDLTAVGAATGTINDSAIPAGESDGLGSLSPRTFGEASLLDFILDPDRCVSFGSAFVKSRASDAFTSQLKDSSSPRRSTSPTAARSSSGSRRTLPPIRTWSPSASRRPSTPIPQPGTPSRSGTVSRRPSTTSSSVRTTR